METPNIIKTIEQLESLYGVVGEASRKKEVDYVHPHYRALIEASPFAVLATCGADGMDASPRGDAPGFVTVEDEHTLLLPDRRGNNRVDSLRNIIANPHVALLFFIPGRGETLRVNGIAEISVEPALLERFIVAGKTPNCVLVIHMQTAFFQCAKAIHRSKLWEPAEPGSALPTSGQMLDALTHGDINSVTYDRELPERLKATLY